MQKFSLSWSTKKTLEFTKRDKDWKDFW